MSHASHEAASMWSMYAELGFAVGIFATCCSNHAGGRFVGANIAMNRRVLVLNNSWAARPKS